jgi:hypothetical protein
MPKGLALQKSEELFASEGEAMVAGKAALAKFDQRPKRKGS